LHERAALDAALTGAKAANLARAATEGLPVLPGFVLTTAATAGGSLRNDAVPALLDALKTLRKDWPGPCVVRSSSTVEDTTTSSMAGQFTSLLGIADGDVFVSAVETVLASARHPRDKRTAAQPMAVLVQPQLETGCGGVLFGLDPVTGDTHHLVVEAVPGTPDDLVSGRVTAIHCVLGRRGRLAGGRSAAARTLLGPSHRRRLALLADNAARAFGGPQDVEWAFGPDDRLWMLQSRAVTATGDGALAEGPVLGPGPLAETFPEPLSRLELDLWAAPLRAAVAAAISATGAVPARRVARSPIIATVGGRVAADLELFGTVPPGGRTKRWWKPFAAGRRLIAAWRVGRLRAVLPALSAEVIQHADADLTAVGPLRELGDSELVDLLCRLRQELIALHGHEVLAGMLLPAEEGRPSLPAVALETLRRGRGDGLADGAIVARHPVVLALAPPAIDPGGSVTLPAMEGGGASLGGHGGVGELGCRDALRLRSRWAQELGARAAGELGYRLAKAGVLADTAAVRLLDLGELRRAAKEHAVPADLAARDIAGPPLPVAFRLTPAGLPVAVAGHHRPHHDGLPASGGRATGIARHIDAAGGRPAPGEPAVLVVDALDPRLAPFLPDLVGLVSETGSALSHLAILAREMHVPAVVGVPDARLRFPDGARLLIDGTTGEVRLTDEEESP
jgi:pyruvate,water dikinase